MATKKAGSADAKAPSASTLRYATASARTTLGDGDEDATVEEVDGVVRFSCRGVPYASLRVDGGELVVGILAPRELGDVADKRSHYRELPGGWLEWRTLASRDPRPWLDASVGSMVGTTMREILLGRTS